MCHQDLRRVALALSLSLVPALGGCASTAAGTAGSGPRAATGPTTAKASPTETRSIELAALVVSPYTDEALAAQFEEGKQMLLKNDLSEARAVFERLLRLSPDGDVAPPSLFNLALALDGLGERGLSVERFRELIARFPAHEAAKSGRVRLARLLGYLERWGDLVGVAEAALAAGDLSVLGSVEARGARALGLIEQGRVDEAERDVMKARDVIEEHRLGEAGRPPIELLPVSFALGEVRRARSEVIRFSPMPPDFTSAFERRCQGLLDAQSAYTDVMRTLDAHWSAMAGFRVGQLYERLHQDVMQITPPPQADTVRRKQLFEGAMRVRYRVLLEKGLRMMGGVVQMGERTGEASAWIDRAREAKRRIEGQLAEEKEALAKLPFTEAELRAGLESIKSP